MKHYNYSDLTKALTKLKINDYSIIYLKSDLRNLGIPAGFDKKNFLNKYIEILFDVINLKKQTVVVNTSSTYLCNTTTPFEKSKTRSESGILSEYIRNLKQSSRSDHPFISYSAIGKKSKLLTSNNSNFSFGENSIEKKMLNDKTVCVCLGIDPRLSCTTIHQVEFEKHVPYRYIKEFNHPILINKKIVHKKYYMHVLYKNMIYKRDRNRKIFKNFYKETKKISVGKGYIYSYNLSDFYNHAIRLFDKNIYVWLENEPHKKPFIK